MPESRGGGRSGGGEWPSSVGAGTQQSLSWRTEEAEEEEEEEEGSSCDGAAALDVDLRTESSSYQAIQQCPPPAPKHTACCPFMFHTASFVTFYFSLNRIFFCTQTPSKYSKLVTFLCLLIKLSLNYYELPLNVKYIFHFFPVRSKYLKSCILRNNFWCVCFF